MLIKMTTKMAVGCSLALRVTIAKSITSKFHICFTFIIQILSLFVLYDSIFFCHQVAHLVRMKSDGGVAAFPERPQHFLER